LFSKGEVHKRRAIETKCGDVITEGPSKARRTRTSEVVVFFSTGSIVAARIRNAGRLLLLTEPTSVVCCALTEEISYQVLTCCIVLTRIGFTFINFFRAVLTSESWQTGTVEVVNQICAVCTVYTRV